jgi:hypothetical protein
VAYSEQLADRVRALVGEDALKRPHTRKMDFTGRPMKGMVFVAPSGIAKKAQLERWVDRALEFADSLPPKR